MADRDILGRLDLLDEELAARLAEIKECASRGDEFMKEMRENALTTREWIENDRRVTREMILELREGREELRSLRHDSEAQTKGLLHVLELDELRRRNGPGGAATA